MRHRATQIPQFVTVENCSDAYSYECHGINCLIHPKYMAMEHFNKNYRDLFYGTLFFFLNYNLRNIFQKPLPKYLREEFHIRPYEPYDMETFVLSNVLGLKLNKEPKLPCLLEQVHAHLSAGRPVFLPLNKKHRSYAPNYGLEDGQNLVLVLGVDLERRLLLINDDVQSSHFPTPLEDGIRYFPFPLSEREALEGIVAADQVYQYLAGHLEVLHQFGPPFVDNPVHLSKVHSTLLKPWSGRFETLLLPKFCWLEAPGVATTRSAILFLSGQKVLASKLGKQPGCEHLQAACLEAAAAWESYRLGLSLKASVPGHIAGLSELKRRVINAEIQFLEATAAVRTELSLPVAYSEKPTFISALEMRQAELSIYGARPM